MSYSSNPEANGRFRASCPRIILIYIHRRDWRSTRKRIIMRIMRGCPDKTPEDTSIFFLAERERKREGGRERKRHAHTDVSDYCATYVWDTYVSWTM